MSELKMGGHTLAQVDTSELVAIGEPRGSIFLQNMGGTGVDLGIGSAAKDDQGLFLPPMVGGVPGGIEIKGETLKNSNYGIYAKSSSLVLIRWQEL